MVGLRRGPAWAVLLLLLALRPCSAMPASSGVAIDWSRTLAVTQTVPTCQVVVEPPLWPTSDVRETQLHWLAELGPEASPVFWQSWFIYPKTGVAELSPGNWDFDQITPLLQDMLRATRGRELVFQFGTVPSWLQNGPTGLRRWDYGVQAWNATQTWGYNYLPGPPDSYSNPIFRNLSQVGEYYANLISYYTAGGFTDAKTGKRYNGFRYNIPWFEFGNEMEYKQTPAVFTQQHDVVAAAVAKVAPGMKFLGLGLGQNYYSKTNLSYFDYFLDSSNHAPGAPRLLLLVNKRMEPSSPIVIGEDWGCVESIDGKSPWAAPTRTAPPAAGAVTLGSFGVAILSEAPCEAL